METKPPDDGMEAEARRLYLRSILTTALDRDGRRLLKRSLGLLAERSGAR